LVTLQSFSYRPVTAQWSFEPPHALLFQMGIEGNRIEGVPVFDGGFTGPDSVRGRAGLLCADAEIGI
jgi:hypothetical protein